jgi:hypothetical protein
VGALALGRVLRALLAGVSAFDPLSFLTVTALLAGCGILAAWVPAGRAIRVDPIASLRPLSRLRPCPSGHRVWRHERNRGGAW